MALVYRDINIQVNFGSGPTMILGQATNVMTENDVARLLITFPTQYSDYLKIMDVAYTNVNGEYLVQSFELSYDDILEKHYFIVDRTFTYNKKIILQFRARYSDGQEVVDPYKLSVSFKDAIKKDNLEEIDADPSPTQTVILQSMVDEHAAVIGSTLGYGHFKVDGTTVFCMDGILSAWTQSSELPVHAAIKAGSETLGHVKVDGTTIISTDGVISSKAQASFETETILTLADSWGDEEVYQTAIDGLTGKPVFFGKQHEIFASKLDVVPYVFRKYNNKVGDYVGWRTEYPYTDISESYTKISFQPMSLKLNRVFNSLFFLMSLSINPLILPGEDIVSIQEIIDWDADIFGTEVSVVKKPISELILIQNVEIPADTIGRLISGVSKGLVFRPTYAPGESGVKDYISISGNSIYITQSGYPGGDYKALTNPLLSVFLDFIQYDSFPDFSVNDRQILLAFTAYNSISANILINDTGMRVNMPQHEVEGYYSSRTFFFDGDPYIATCFDNTDIGVYSFEGTEIGNFTTNFNTLMNLSYTNEGFDIAVNNSVIYIAYHVYDEFDNRVRLCLSTIVKNDGVFTGDTRTIYTYDGFNTGAGYNQPTANTPSEIGETSILPVSISFENNIPLVAFGNINYYTAPGSSESDVYIIKCGTELELYETKTDDVNTMECGMYGEYSGNKFVEDLLVYNGVYYYIYKNISATSYAQQRFLCSYNPVSDVTKVLWAFPTNFNQDSETMLLHKYTLFVEDGCICCLFMERGGFIEKGLNDRTHSVAKVLKYKV